jgi:hypothetical protein
MFVLRGLGKLLLGGNAEADLLSIESGEIWRVQYKKSGTSTVINRVLMYHYVRLVHFCSNML